jgi:hypothetical protein
VQGWLESEHVLVRLLDAAGAGEVLLLLLLLLLLLATPDSNLPVAAKAMHTIAANAPIAAVAMAAFFTPEHSAMMIPGLRV